MIKLNLVPKKACTICEETKYVTEFHSCTKMKCGYNSACKKCQAKKAADYRMRNEVKAKECQRRSTAKNPVRVWAQHTLGSHRHYTRLITTKELFDIAKDIKHCQICDVELAWRAGGKCGGPIDISPSLDRLNNEQHISDDNIQIICYRCNTTKGPRTQQQFIDYCKMVADKFSK